jgi:hypothetical protein
MRVNRGARIDSTGRYRYTLWRGWDPGRPRVAFVMLNPSTAGAERDDPTLRRCIRFAHDWGFGSVEVVNLFALRSRSPRSLRRAADPVGPENDRHLLETAARARRIVAAWGVHGALGARDRAVTRILGARRRLHCLGTTAAGHPRHPLYLPVDTPLVPYRPGEALSFAVVSGRVTTL